MIKIKIAGTEATLEGRAWSCENKTIEDILNFETAHRPFDHSPRVEKSIADYIVSTFKEEGEVETIFDSKEDRPKKPRNYNSVY